MNKWVHYLAINEKYTKWVILMIYKLLFAGNDIIAGPLQDTLQGFISWHKTEAHSFEKMQNMHYAVQNIVSITKFKQNQSSTKYPPTPHPVHYRSPLVTTSMPHSLSWSLNRAVEL